MSIRNATIRQLQIFAAAARTLSFARVAEQFRLTPGAISFQIKQIEGLCGFPLFERVGRSVVLTDAGAALLDHATVILKELNDADQQMEALRGSTGGSVTLGLVSTAKYIVPHLLSRFQAERPGVTITLQDGNRRKIHAAVIKGDVDIAIMGRPSAEVVESVAFANHPSTIIAAPNHPLTRGGRLRLHDLESERFIVREEGSGTRALMDGFFRSQGLTPRIAMTTSSNEMIKQAVMAGIGIALISRHTIQLELGIGLLRELDIEGLPLMRAWYVVHRRSLPLLPVHSQFRQFMQERGQSIIDDLARRHTGRQPTA
ncbi:LysR family transcriptional regulator [Rhodocista pekingensis]|uniref:HTH-type transcriptional regulator CbbR n=1 Tax=Rhodocista pekingensis TaxID=201185 RepID=A0ABW2KZQ1_9PROT